MKHRSIPAILATAAIAIPAGATWAVAHQPVGATATTARATATPTSRKTTTHKAPAKISTYKYTGPSVDMEWGPVQVTIVVKGKRITDVQASAPTERSRSAFINQQAIPMLRGEVLQAQSATIDLIGGATLTSEAYAQSLQAVVDKAHGAHTL